ncbi:hypothetical protein ACFFIX_14735 [Metabacillus herbersteinensis]|uniref:Uncharacterized protein n=1 Tax=Metabacillus herbersteinensis TaxID=283816 RepID=A0ABV6GG84_9BACI
MSNHTVDVYAFFVNGANQSENRQRVHQDIQKANLVWEGCITFVLRGLYFSANQQKIDASSILDRHVFNNKQIDSIIQNRNNLMYPISPNKLPVVTTQQCQIAKQSNLANVRARKNQSDFI